MAYTTSDAYCSVGDVESRVARGTFSTTTAPTLQQVTDFMALRGAEVSTRARDAGLVISPASGTSPISTTTDDGKALERLARLANELLAAGDAIAAHESRDSAEIPSGATQLWELGKKALDAIATQVALMSTLGAGIAPKGFTEEKAIDTLLHHATMEF